MPSLWGSFVYFEGVFVCFLYWLFVACIIVQCGYAFFFFSRLFLAKQQTHPTQPANLPPVSIIICAKNEAANLRQNLPAILAQRYMNEAGKPQYEVIVVNDASTDDTAAVLKELELKYDNLWDVSIPQDAPRTLPGKKFALSQALQYVQNELLVLTDADCKPVSDDWLQQMVAPLIAGKDIVAGYGGYYKESSLLNTFVRTETVHTFLQYSSYALAGVPYMAVGRNVACKKTILQKAQKDDSWSALPSGDDDLLINIMGSSGNTAIVFSKDSFTHSAAKANWGDWVKQKQRHVSTAKYYKKTVIALLTIYAATHAAVWLAFFILLCTGMWQMAMLWMLCRCLLFWLMMAGAAQKLQEKKLVWFLPLFDFGWMLYNFAFSPYIIWKNKQQWK